MLRSRPHQHLPPPAPTPEQHLTASLAPPPAAAAPLPDFLTVAQVADLLQLSTKTVYALARDHALAGCVRLGNTLRFNRDQLLDGLSRQALAGDPKHRRTRRLRPRGHDPARATAINGESTIPQTRQHSESTIHPRTPSPLPAPRRSPRP